MSPDPFILRLRLGHHRDDRLAAVAHARVRATFALGAAADGEEETLPVLRPLAPDLRDAVARPDPGLLGRRPLRDGADTTGSSLESRHLGAAA